MVETILLTQSQIMIISLEISGIWFCWCSQSIQQKNFTSLLETPDIQGRLQPNELIASYALLIFVYIMGSVRSVLEMSGFYHVERWSGDHQLAKQQMIWRRGRMAACGCRNY